jgi:hypothetical protein
MHIHLDKPDDLSHLVKAMYKPFALAGSSGSNRNTLPRRNTGAAIALRPERSC